MAEEKEEKKDEKKEEKKTAKKEAQQDSIALINRANEAADRIEKGNTEMRDLLDRRDRMKVEETLSGKTEAGNEAITEEQKADQAARDQLKGTGFEDQLFPKEQEKAE